MQKKLVFAAGLLCLALTQPAARAQGLLGSILGSVTDPN